MRFLLDTNVLLRLMDEGDLSAEARDALSAPGAEGWASVVSLWEVEIKHRIGKLPVSPAAFHAGIAASNLQLLPVLPGHVLFHGALPPPGAHRDPFDRMLLAQALHEGLTFVTSDRKLHGQGVPILAA